MSLTSRAGLRSRAWNRTLQTSASAIPAFGRRPPYNANCKGCSCPSLSLKWKLSMHGVKSAFSRSSRPSRVSATASACSMTAIVVGAVLGGMVVGCLCALMVVKSLRRQVDPFLAVRENAVLREKVDDLQQLLLKLQPMARGDMKLQFTKGVNRNVILGMVDQMLKNKDVNIWWLPDDIERLIYVNVITLMLQVMDEVVASMSINFAGHNVKMQLTYLEAAAAEAQLAAAVAGSPEAAAAMSLNKKEQQLLKSFQSIDG